MRYLIIIFALFFFNLNAQEKPSTASKNVDIISEKFEIPQLNTNRRIWIYLPPDYTTTSKKWSVFYLHDGQNLFDDKTSYSGEWQIDEALNNIFNQTNKSAIIVGIDNGGEQRIAELSAFKNEKYGGGDGEKYVQFITQTLKPYIDNHYRTKTSKKHTIIGGSSLGGLISVYAAVKSPEIFGKILAFSPAFWFNSKEMNAFIQTSKNRLKHQKYYFVQGKFEDEGMDKETLKVIENLKSKGVKPKNIFFRIDEDGKHNEKYWRREFPAAFLWLIK